MCDSGDAGFDSNAVDSFCTKSLQLNQIAFCKSDHCKGSIVGHSKGAAASRQKRTHHLMPMPLSQSCCSVVFLFMTRRISLAASELCNNQPWSSKQCGKAPAHTRANSNTPRTHARTHAHTHINWVTYYRSHTKIFSSRQWNKTSTKT